MKRLFVGLLFFSFTTTVWGVSQREVNGDVVRTRRTTALQLEHAVTPDQIAWGLMQRTELPQNGGMTFQFPRPRRPHFWMFNCLMDLSVAFIDKDRVIREIHPLDAHPEMMGKSQKVLTVNDLRKISTWSPAYRFFLERAVAPRRAVSFALEMRQGWFASNDTAPGDVVLWDVSEPTGTVLHSIDVGGLLQADEESLVITFSEGESTAFWAPSSKDPLAVTCYDGEGQQLAKRNLPPSRKGSWPAVIVIDEPVLRCVVAKKSFVDNIDFDRPIPLLGEQPAQEIAP